MANGLRIPTQQEMAFAEAQRRRAQRDAEAVRASNVLTEVRRVIDHVGAKEVADRMGLEDDSIIWHWLSGRGGRRLPWELVDVCIDLDDTDRLAQVVLADRYETPVRIRRLSPEQEVQLLRRALQEFGAAGELKLRTIATAKPEEGP